MRKKIVLILTLICIAAACAALCACTGDTLEELRAEGYVVSVTYDANGGNFGEPGQKLLVDLFNPDDYEKEADGTVHIYLQDLSSRRNEQGTKFENVASRSSYGFWGWYQNRELYTDADGNILDEDGNILDEVKSEESDGEITYTYRIRGTDTESTPLYIYTDEWDFENDYIVYRGEDELDITLYAVWIPYFVFDFYYIDEVTGEEINFGQTSFDYVSSTEDNMRGYLFLPAYPDEGGKMVYSYSPSSGYTYTFPSLSGYTFGAAYYYDEDGEKTYIEDEKLKHTGYVDENTTLAVNSVMKIYVEFLEGDVCEIRTAEQFRENASSNLVYVICGDLDFNCDSEGDALDDAKVAVLWPSSLDVNTFTGRIYTDGGTYTLSNIYVRHQTGSAGLGGLFGCLGEESVIENIVFENVAFDFYSLDRTTRRGNYALFAGDIEEGATLYNVTLTGNLTFRLGSLSTDDVSNSLSIVSNAANWDELVDLKFSPVSVSVEVYSTSRSTSDTYRYSIIVFDVAVDEETGSIEYSLASGTTDKYTYVDENGSAAEGTYLESCYVVYSWER